MAEDIILPEVEEPTVEIEQFLVNDSAEESTEAPLPTLVIGPKVRAVSATNISELYEGLLLTAKLPDFEVSSKVIEDSNFIVKLKNIKVRVGSEVLKGTITHSGDDIILQVTDGTNPIPASTKGYALGDAVTIRTKVHNAATGQVLITERTKLTNTASGTAFVDVVPGDTLVFKATTEFGDVNWKSTNPSSIKEYTVTEVGTGGSYIIVNDVLDVGTGLNFVVVRQVSTSIAIASPVDTAATKTRLASNVDTGSVEFKIIRSLTTGTVTGDQPLASDYVVSSSNYTLVDGTETKDSIRIVASLTIPVFTNFAFTFAGTGALVVATDANLLTVAGQNLTTGANAIEAGDTIYFKNTANVAVSATVASVAFTSPNTLITLVQAQGTDVTGATIYGVYKDGIGTTLPIVSSNVNITYRAKSLKDAYKLLTIAKTTDLDQLGERAIYNEIRVAGQIAKSNAGTNAIYAIITEDTSIESFSIAFEVAEGTNAYTIVPLSQSVTIQGIGKVHVDSMSTAKKANWRCLFGNVAKPLEKAVVPLKSSGMLKVAITKTGAAIASGSLVELIDPSANFSTTVFPDMFVKVYEQANVAASIPQSTVLANSASYVDSLGATKYFRIYKVKAKLSNTKLSLEPLAYTGELGVYSAKLEASIVAETANYTGRYEVIKILTKDEIAQEVGKLIRSFNDRRVNIISNSSCGIAFTNALGVEVIETMPGYMIAAAVAGLASNTAPHQPMSRIELSGIARVYDGREFYSSDQLSVIATAGGWTTVQDSATSRPYTWKQTTTSQAGVKEKEWSVTKNVDEISKALYNDLKPFPGRNNNVAATITAVDQQITTTLEQRTVAVKGINDTEIGPQIISYSTTGSAPVPNLLDTILNRITLVVPIPLNKIKITIFA